MIAGRGIHNSTTLISVFFSMGAMITMYAAVANRQRALTFAAGMGLIGGFFPAIRAARISPVIAMRGG